MAAPRREFSAVELRRMRQMVEDGVPHDTIATRFRTNGARVRLEAKEQGWKAPARGVWSRDTCRIPIPDEQACGVRRVQVTATGLPIGHTEPLDPDNPYRGKVRAIKAYRQALARARGRSAGTRAAEMRWAAVRGA